MTTPLTPLTVSAVAAAILLSAGTAPRTLPAAAPGGPAPASRPAVTRILFIGNSYTSVNSLPNLLAGLAASAKPPRRLEVAQMTPGGCTLEKHWTATDARKAIAAGPWNYVVLQEQSLMPIMDPQRMHKYARLLDADIRKAGAKTVFYMTWARRNTPETQDALTEAYAGIARELGAQAAPVGVAWRNALKADPKLVLHRSDGSHPTPAGSYLAACVFYATLFDESPVGLAREVREPAKDGKPGKTLASLTDAQAAFLQKIAWETVKTSPPGREKETAAPKDKQARPSE